MHEDVRTIADATIEKDEVHFTLYIFTIVSVLIDDFSHCGVSIMFLEYLRFLLILSASF